MESYINLKKLSNKNSQAEFRAEVPLEVVLEHERHQLQRLSKDFSIPGFRKGKVPEAILRENIDPGQLVEEAAESAVRDAIQDIAETEDLKAIGTPKVSVETLEIGKPIVFTVRFALEPEVELPDYKAIGKEIFSRKQEVEVSEKEIGDALLEIRRMAMQATGEKDLPELNDAFAEKLGGGSGNGGVKTLAALKEEVKKELTHSKERAFHEEKHGEVLKTIVQKSKMATPELLVEQELAHFLEHRNSELERLGLTREAYLKEIKKTEKELGEEERSAIEERVRTSFVFRKIQESENITASENEITVQTTLLKRRYPSENPQTLRRTAEATIIEGKIFKVLEPAAEPVGETIDEPLEKTAAL